MRGYAPPGSYVKGISSHAKPFPFCLNQVHGEIMTGIQNKIKGFIKLLCWSECDHEIESVDGRRKRQAAIMKIVTSPVPTPQKKKLTC